MNDSKKKKIGVADLRIGGRYRHHNGSWVRVIRLLQGDTVHWEDELGAGVCSRAHFIKTCPSMVAGQERTATATPPQHQRPSLPTAVDPEVDTAMFIAMVVRNAMEDFHAEHLSDDQMRQLNPIIRDAVYTALHVLRVAESDDAARAFLAVHTRMIPTYWEKPSLLDDYCQTRQELANRRQR